MTVPDTSESAQTDGEGPDGSDKPPHDDIPPTTSTATNTKSPTSRPTISPMTANGVKPSSSIPLPPPDADAYPKEPGRTRRSLERLAIKQEPTTTTTTTGSKTPSSNSSPTVSDCESWSAPSTRPPSEVPSRHPSVSGGPSGNKLATPSKAAVPVPVPVPAAAPTPRPPALVAAHATPEPAPAPAPAPAPSTRSKPASVHSDDGRHKFTLKDLLASGPKLARKSSNRSTGGSSRKSNSDGGGGKSIAGDSAASLATKYGVCQKVAIGKGATSVVRLAHKWDRSEEKLYAVKEFRKRRKNESEKEYVKKLTAEFCISSTLHHINIVETVDLVQDEQQHWCEVMEFCPGGDLYAAIKKGGMSPSEVECCFKQILNGVSYLHSQGVAHRDIKPENLFFDTKGHLKIGDYGASTVYRLPWEATIHMSTGLCGSEPYIAPEQFLGKPYDARLVDIWACGIVYYCLHFQELPWRAAQATDQLYASYASACASPQPAQSTCPPTINNLSPRACRTLIRKMLDPDPKQRFSIEDVIAHPWVQSIEVCHTVEKPAHVHVHARALAQAQFGGNI